MTGGLPTTDRTAPPDAAAGLWAQWQARRGPAEREALVTAYTRFVRIMAAKSFARRISAELEFGDYLQFGMVGLLEAIDRFDPAVGVKFETFAAHRIQGAILNGVQHLSEVQRQASVRRQVLKERTSTLSEGGESAGKASALDRLAELAIGLALGFALEESVLYVGEDEPALPDNAYQRTEMRQLGTQLRECVQALPDPQRQIIQRHYFQQVTFEEIAGSLGLSKGRISQLHHQALRRLLELHRQRLQFFLAL